jgi:hypothetical protein
MAWASGNSAVGKLASKRSVIEFFGTIGGQNMRVVADLCGVVAEDLGGRQFLGVAELVPLNGLEVTLK